MIIAFQIIVLVLSAVIHEYMHGYAAYLLGDHTAKDAGRLSLNPVAHLDPVGSILIPIILIVSKAGFIFGWAKPVPYNPNFLRDKKYGEAKVALAGPLSNFVIALVFALLIRFLPHFNLMFSNLLSIIVIINLALMVLNLLPIPPLDGSKILAAFLPYNLRQSYLALERYGFFILILLIVTVPGFLFVPVYFLFQLFLGGI